MNIETQLREAAKRLPVVYDRVRGGKMMTLAEINDAGVRFEVPAEDREAVLKNPGMRFPVEIEYRVKRNHYRRMKNAYKRGGDQAVVKYIHDTYEIAKRAK